MCVVCLLLCAIMLRSTPGARYCRCTPPVRFALLALLGLALFLLLFSIQVTPPPPLPPPSSFLCVEKICPEPVVEIKLCDRCPTISSLEPVTRKECALDDPDFPLFMGLLRKKDPRVRIFLHDPSEDQWVTGSVFTSQGKGGYFEEAYSLSFLSFLEQEQKRQPLVPVLFVDVGAHIGIHSLLVAASGYDVHAFEPHPANQRLLRCSRLVNGNLTRAHLTLHPVALGETDGSLCMTFSEGNRGNTFLTTCTPDLPHVDIRTLDAYWSEDMQGRQITLLKIDVEGYEAAALRGAHQMMTKNPPLAIQAEFYAPHFEQSGARPLEIFEILIPLGYHVSVVRTGESTAMAPHDITNSWKAWVAKAIATGAMNDLLFTLPRT